MTEERGRPSIFTDEIAVEICSRMVEGESLRHICDDDHMPGTTTVFRWLADNERFRDQYAKAREAQADFMAMEILDIADDGTNDWVERENKDGSTYIALNSEHVNRSRLRVDTRKWIMARLQPKKYGDSTNLKHSGPDGEPITAINVNVIPQPKSDDTA